MGVVHGAVRRSVLLGAAGAILVLASCGGAHDQAAGLTKEDYEALKARRPAADARPVEEPPIPDLQPILAAPQPPTLADSRRVTIQATEPTPVRDLLIEIARKADIDLELDPRIEGGVIFTARDRPIKDVVERIADLANLRYDFADNRLRVELDEPYLESYRVDILAQRRQTETRIASSTDVFSAVGEGAAAGGDNLSAVSVTSSADADIWTEIATNIEAIINQAVPQPRTAAVSGAAAPIGGLGATPPAAPGEAAPGAPGAPGASGAAEGAATPVEQAQQIAQLQEALTQASAAGAGGAAAGAAPASGAAPAAAGTEGNGHYFVVNRQAGIVSAYTTQRQHRKIGEYLAAIQRNTQAQVLIEAKIVEVLLNDEFRAGIDWDVALNNVGWVNATTAGFDLARGVAADLATNNFSRGEVAFTASTDKLSIEGALDLVSRFGTTRTLSSPRLTVLNNQNAVLKVAENYVYFTVEIEREFDDETRQEINRTYSSEIHTVPIGVILNVQPSINLETRQISMSLRPTISRVADEVPDPAIALVVADINSRGGNIGLESPIPVVEVREMDSVVTLGSGDVAVLGGLMQERAESVEEGVPGVKDVPILGAPFKKQMEDTQVVELVIFLRATIVNGRDSVHQQDIELYNKFAPDPRPIAF